MIEITPFPVVHTADYVITKQFISNMWKDMDMDMDFSVTKEIIEDGDMSEIEDLADEEIDFDFSV